MKDELPPILMRLERIRKLEEQKEQIRQELDEARMERTEEGTE